MLSPDNPGAPAKPGDSTPALIGDEKSAARRGIAEHEAAHAAQHAANRAADASADQNRARRFAPGNLNPPKKGH